MRGDDGIWPDMEPFDDKRLRRGGGLGGAGEGTEGGDLRCMSFVPLIWNFRNDEYCFFELSYVFSSIIFDSSASFIVSDRYLWLGDSDADLWTTFTYVDAKTKKKHIEAVEKLQNMNSLTYSEKVHWGNSRDYNADFADDKIVVRLEDSYFQNPDYYYGYCY